MSPALLLILSGAAAAQSPAGAGPRIYGPRPPPPDCRHPDKREIIVCGQRRQVDRPDPDVSDAASAADTARRSEIGTLPSAQAACASQPTGCVGGLAGLDLVNVAVVLGTAAARAAKGEDWKQPLRHGPDEYRLYLEAKRKREEGQRLAAAERARALAHATESGAAPAR